MRIAQHDASAHADQLVDEEETRLEHLLVDDDDPFALRRRDEGDGHRIRGEGGPRLILELWHRAAEIAADHHVLLPGDDQVLSLDAADDAEPLEAHQSRAEVLHARTLDGDLGARDRSQSDEGADLDVIRADLVGAPAKGPAAVDGDGVGADALDARAHGDEELGQILHVRFTRRVAEHRDALSGHGSGERVLGGGDARLIEEDVGATKALGAQDERVVEREAGPELLQREAVGIAASATDAVAPWRRQLDLAAPRGQRAGGEDRRADLPAEGGVQLGRLDLLRVDRERVAGGPLGARTDRLDEIHQRLHVADARHVLEMYRLLGEERGRDDRQSGVLVAGWADAAGQSVAALDEELLCAHWSGAMGGRTPERPRSGSRKTSPARAAASSGRLRLRRASAEALHPSRRTPPRTHRVDRLDMRAEHKVRWPSALLRWSCPCTLRGRSWSTRGGAGSPLL